MPIYVYECGNCGHRFQVLQGFRDPEPGECPQCGSKGNIHRVMAPTSFVLKGSGWYATDYRSKPDSGLQRGNEYGRHSSSKKTKKVASKGG